MIPQAYEGIDLQQTKEQFRECIGNAKRLAQRTKVLLLRTDARLSAYVIQEGPPVVLETDQNPTAE